MERHSVSSGYTGSEMSVIRHGECGVVLVYVPGSAGDAEEFGDYGMAEICRPWFDRGQVQVFAIDGWARNTLWNEALDARERIRAYARYERYVAGELLPWIAERTAGALPLIIGCSYGAFVAANLLLKHPQRVAGACGLGGVYGMWHRLGGYHDDDVYFHTPLEYLPRLDDPAVLNAIETTDGLTMFAGERDEWLWSTVRMAAVMREKRLRHSVDIWPAPANHHERWWGEQLRLFLSRRLGG